MASTLSGVPRRWRQRRNLKAPASKGPLIALQSGQPVCRNTPTRAAVPDISGSEPVLGSESDSFSESGSESGSDSCPDSESDTNSVSDSDSDSDSSSESDSESDSHNDCEFYNQLISGFEKEGPTMANRGGSAKEMIRVEEKKWIQ